MGRRLVEGDTARADNPVSDRIVNLLGRIVNGVADKDALLNFRRELESLGGVHVNIGGHPKTQRLEKFGSHLVREVKGIPPVPLYEERLRT